MKQRLTKRRLTEALYTAMGSKEATALALDLNLTELDNYLARWGLWDTLIDAAAKGRAAMCVALERGVIDAAYEGNIDAALALLRTYHPAWKAAAGGSFQFPTDPKPEAVNAVSPARTFGLAALAQGGATE